MFVHKMLEYFNELPQRYMQTNVTVDLWENKLFPCFVEQRK